jgi:hypothetical protein
VHGVLALNGVPVAVTSPDPDDLHIVDANTSSTWDLEAVRETLGSGRTYLTAVDRARPVEMPATHVASGYFLLSDNRRHGSDSRTYGEVHPSLCKGKALLLLFPGPGHGMKAPSERRLTPIE